MNVDETYQALRAKGEVLYEVARPWVEGELEQIVQDDAVARGLSFATFDVRVASDHEDMVLATDYVVTATAQWVASVAVRCRDVDRSRRRGYPIRQMTLRQKGTRGNREYDKVLGLGPRGQRIGPAMGDYYATLWFSGLTLDSAIIVDLARLRGLAPDHLMRLEVPGMSNVPFVGYDAAALIAHGTVRAAYPDPAYFGQFVPAAGIPGQGVLL